MNLFGKPNIEKLEAKRDIKGLIKALGYDDDQIPAAAIRALARIGAPAVDLLIVSLTDTYERVRYFAVEALGEIGDARAVESIVAAIKDTDKYVRRSAANILGKFGDARALEPLIAAIRDNDDDVREVATRSLGEIGDSRAAEPLIAILRDKDSDITVRDAAAEALGKIGESGVRSLLAALEDSDGTVCDLARITISILDDPRAVELLIVALKDSNANVRGVAALGLGSIGDTRAVEPLVAALEDSDTKVRGYIAEALSKIKAPGKISDARAVEPLEARSMTKTLLDQLLDGKSAGTVKQVRDAFANVACNLEFAVSVNTWETQKYLDETNKKGFIAWGNQDAKSAIIYGAGFLDQDNFDEVMAWLNRIRVKNDVSLVHLLTDKGDKVIVIE